MVDNRYMSHSGSAKGAVMRHYVDDAMQVPPVVPAYKEPVVSPFTFNDLRPLVTRFSIVEVAALGALAPLAEPESVALALERELETPLSNETLGGIIN